MVQIRCASCQLPLPDTPFLQGGRGRCSYCQKPLRVFLEKALYQPIGMAPPPLQDETPPAEGEAVCFYNPARRATKVCDHCGVYISDAWAAPWGSMTICLKCLEQLRSKSQDQRFEASRTLWDNVALGLVWTPLLFGALSLVLILTIFLGFIPVLVLGATMFTAPAALFLGLRFWNAPRSLAPRGRTRLILALILALALIVVWSLLFFQLSRTSHTKVSAFSSLLTSPTVVPHPFDE